MPQPIENYEGREQTYVKHFFLEKYLERVAYNILSSRDEFVYVDGFSGPWKTRHEAFEDTSFMIAVRQLRRIRDSVSARTGRQIRIRCFFCEADPSAFKDLQQAAQGITDMSVTAIRSEFEAAIPSIVRFIGRAFSLSFVDPTGWTGYRLDTIRPLLELRGEVLINFMFHHLNRFLEDPRPGTASSYDGLFGDPDWFGEWSGLTEDGVDREEAILRVYRNRLRRAGNFAHVTSTRILKPLSEQTYFHLVYGTRHLKGLEEFRKVEKQMVPEQEKVREGIRQASTQQLGLFAGDPLVASYRAEKDRRCAEAKRRLVSFLRQHKELKYEVVLAHLLETPLVWESDIKEWIAELKMAGHVVLPDLRGRETVPKKGQFVRWSG